MWERGHADVDLRGMGTTMIAAALVATDDGDRLVLANVGDSRAYRLHGDELVQLTTDHSVAEELVARGELSEEEAAVHPHRHILTRALGVQPDVAVDVWQLVPEEGDRFLLCSDGLTNEVPAEEITDVLSATRDPQEAAETLVRMANEAGGNDNATVVVLDVMVGEPLRPSRDGAGAGESAAAATAAPPVGPVQVRRSLGAGGSDHGGEPSRVHRRPQPPEPRPGRDRHRQRRGRGGRQPVRSRHGRWPAPRPARTTRRTGARIPRRITFRVLLFLVVLGGLAYGGFATVRWYVNNSYFVGLSHNQVVIYQGRPGGFVGINPKIVKRTQVTARQVPSYKVPDLRSRRAGALLHGRQGLCHEPPAVGVRSATSQPPPIARPSRLRPRRARPHRRRSRPRPRPPSGCPGPRARRHRQRARGGLRWRGASAGSVSGWWCASWRCSCSSTTCR